jgi:hypothetical protein
MRPPPVFTMAALRSARRPLRAQHRSETRADTLRACGSRRTLPRAGFPRVIICGQMGRFYVGCRVLEAS